MPHAIASAICRRIDAGYQVGPEVSRYQPQYGKLPFVDLQCAVKMLQSGTMGRTMPRKSKSPDMYILSVCTPSSKLLTLQKLGFVTVFLLFACDM